MVSIKRFVAVVLLPAFFVATMSLNSFAVLCCLSACRALRLCSTSKNTRSQWPTRRLASIRQVATCGG